jgi:hypothetical protein
MFRHQILVKPFISDEGIHLPDKDCAAAELEVVRFNMIGVSIIRGLVQKYEFWSEGG